MMKLWKNIRKIRSFFQKVWLPGVAISQPSVFWCHFITCGVVTLYPLESFQQTRGWLRSNFSKSCVCISAGDFTSAADCLMIVVQYFKINIFFLCPEPFHEHREDSDSNHFLLGVNCKGNEVCQWLLLTCIQNICACIGLPRSVLTNLLYLTILPVALQTCELH